MGQFINGKFIAFDGDGAPLSGGKLYTYEAGTTTNKTTYSDYDYSTPNANPVVLDSRGEAVVFGTGLYKFVLKDSDDTTIWTVDNISPSGSLLDSTDTGLFINEDANAKSTIGLTINQGANDDEIISLKSSDCNHGVTTLTETDTFAFMQKSEDALSGLKLVGISANDIGMEIRGVATTAPTDDPPLTTTHCPIELRAYKKSGTSTTAFAAGEAIFNVSNGTIAEFVVMGDGELYSNQSATVGTFDVYEDALMCRDLSYALTEQYGKIMRYNKELFMKLKIMSHDGMVSLTKMNMLELGAIGQLYNKILKLCDKLGIDPDDLK